MECLITLCYPALPPTPTRTEREKPRNKPYYYTYAAHLEEPQHSHVSPNIISLIMRMQAHLPEDRPKLHELETYVTTMIAETKGEGKTMAELLAWLQKVFNEPAPPAPAAQPPQPFGVNQANQNFVEVIGVRPVNPIPNERVPRTLYKPPFFETLIFTYHPQLLPYHMGIPINK
jgi:hypothetical protein